MSVIFDPSGLLNIATDPSDLPSTAEGNNVISNALTRCKNLRVNQGGKVSTRDGSTKLNATAIATAIWWIEELEGYRYTFAGTVIYKDETSIATGMTSAQWAAIQYNAFNDDTKQVFALNGTDRKRVEASSAYEWGLEAPTVDPILGVGAGTGLTGEYQVRYTYVRKVGSTVVAESNPSDPAATSQVLSNQSLTVDIGAPSDAQVTHARLYRTLAGGSIFYLDTEIAVSTAYAYGYAHDWEESEAYLAGTGYDFTITDSTHSTENTHSWEETFLTHSTTDTGDTGTPPGFDFDEYRYSRWSDDPRMIYK